jgi:Superfamily II helicase
MNYLDNLPIDDKIKKVIRNRGYNDLRELQYEAISKGLEDKNILVNVATGGGKTLISEVIAIQELLKHKGGKVIYLAPIRALAYEKFKEFKDWNAIGLTREMSVGDYQKSIDDMKEANLLIMTYEKFDSLLRKEDKEWLKDIRAIVFDEIHTIGNENRGATIEFLISYFLGKCKLIGLSATIGNLDEIATWMNANVYRKSERVNKITKGVLQKGTLVTENLKITKYGKDYEAFLKAKVDEDKQIIIFVRSRRDCESLSRKLSPKLSRKYKIQTNDKTLLKRFAPYINGCVLYHNAGLTSKERRFVEEEYNNGNCRVLVATPTLAMGVNLPCDVVLVRDILRVEDYDSFQMLDLLDVEQMLGRAGRWGEGEGYLYTSSDFNPLMRKYIKGEMENANSQLYNSEKFKSYVLTMMGNQMHTIQELCNFFNKTFFAYSYKMKNTKQLRNKILSMLDTLIDENFIKVHDDNYYLTEKGTICVESYLSPKTVNIMEGIEVSEDVSCILSQLVECEEFTMPRVLKKEVGVLQQLAIRHNIVTKDMRKAKVLLMFNEHFKGIPATKFKVKYNVPATDFGGMKNDLSWLIHGLQKVYFMNNKKKSFVIMNLATCVEKGVPMDVAPLVRRSSITKKKALTQSGNGSLSKWL